MDNLILLRDIIDIASLNGENVGIFAVDQKKAFDRVSHFYLFIFICFICYSFWGWVEFHLMG